MLFFFFLASNFLKRSLEEIYKLILESVFVDFWLKLVEIFTGNNFITSLLQDKFKKEEILEKIEYMSDCTL